MARSLWSVILAGGAGRRLFAVTNGTPKQFWRLDGRSSLIEETIARIAPIADTSHTALIVDRSHGTFVREAGLHRAGAVLYQPQDRGTAAGVLFGLTPVLEAEPDAVVLVTPSDHGVRHPGRFRESVLSAAAAVLSGRQQIVIFGVAPSGACADYGWIECGPRQPGDGPRLQHVTGFVEKPSADDAERLFQAGAVWNSMVVVARAAALAALFEAQALGLAALFAEYRRWPAAYRDAWLADRYADLATVDFSRDILAPARGLAVCVWPASLGWADLGTPDRLQHWWDRMPGRRAAADARRAASTARLHVAPQA
jgi:mannose-1-phosphate guanylyltransferase